MTWKRARAAVHSCGSCLAPIADGEVYAVTRTGLVRCATCAADIEPQPSTIADDEDAYGVASGVAHQSSIGIAASRPPVFMSAGELANRQRQRLAAHLRNRQRGTR